MSSDNDNGTPSTYKSIQDWPGYPRDFQPEQDGFTVHRVKDKGVLRHLRSILPGDWAKVFKDGWVRGKKKSIHFFRHESGRIAYPKVKNR